MGAYCLRALIPSHPASIGEVLKVLWCDFYGAVIFGDREEIACIPHAGCRLEIVATPPISHSKVNLLVPGQVIQYKHSFFLRDRFVLPSGATVRLWHLVGFKLHFASGLNARPADEALAVKHTGEPSTGARLTFRGSHERRGCVSAAARGQRGVCDAALPVLGDGEHETVTERSASIPSRVRRRAQTADAMLSPNRFYETALGLATMVTLLTGFSAGAPAQGPGSVGSTSPPLAASGSTYCRTGQREQAQEHLTTAATMYREMDLRFWLEKAEAQVN